MKNQPLSGEIKMRDIDQGRLLLALSIIAIVVYFWAVFLSPADIVDPVFKRNISQWAVIIPVFIFVGLFLFIVAWIGWAMATTPPPLPLKEESLEEDKNEDEKKDEKKHPQTTV